GGFVARLLFHGIELGDPLDGAPGDDGPIAFEDLDELAADMDHASLLRGEPFAEQAIEAGKAVGMHAALVAREMGGGMFPLSVHAELIPRAGRCLSAPWAFIADVAPEPGGLGFACLRTG